MSTKKERTVTSDCDQLPQKNSVVETLPKNIELPKNKKFTTYFPRIAFLKFCCGNTANKKFTAHFRSRTTTMHWGKHGLR